MGQVRGNLFLLQSGHTAAVGRRRPTAAPNNLKVGTHSHSPTVIGRNWFTPHHHRQRPPPPTKRIYRIYLYAPPGVLCGAKHNLHVGVAAGSNWITLVAHAYDLQLFPTAHCWSAACSSHLYKTNQPRYCLTRAIAAFRLQIPQRVWGSSGWNFTTPSKI